MSLPFPENIDATYLDTGSASAKVHQQHHDWVFTHLNLPRGPLIVVAPNGAPGWIRNAAGRNGASTYQCDGTDDQAQVEQAFADLPAGGGTVLLAAGTHQWSNLPAWPDKDNIGLVGMGAGQRTGATQDGVGTKVQLVSGFAGSVGLRVQRASNDRPVYGALLRDFVLDGANLAGIEGILFRSNRGLIDNVHVHRMGSHGIRILGYTTPATWATYDTMLRGVQAGDNGGDGLFFDEQAQDCHVVGAVLFGNGTNLRIAAGSQQVVDLHTYDADTRNCVFQGGSRTKIHNWKCEGAAQEGIYFDGTTSGASDIEIHAQLADNGRSANNTYPQVGCTGTQAYSRTKLDLMVSRKTGQTNLATYAFDFSSIMRDTVITGFTADPTHFATGIFRDQSPAANRTRWGNSNQPYLYHGDGQSGSPRVWVGGASQPSGMQAGDYWIHDA